MDMIEELYENYISGNKRITELQHRVAVELNIPDSEMWTLYCLCASPNKVYTQDLIAGEMGLPRQTVNSAVNRLLKNDFVYLEKLPSARNNKQILLTEKGNDFCQKQILPLVNAELNAFYKMTDEEKETFLSLINKYNRFQIEALQTLLGELRGD